MNDNDTLADDLRKDSLALMKLLADEKHKSEALAAELAGVRSDLAMCEAKGSSLQMRTDKADLLRVLGVADERIRALEALNSRLANDINCGELLPQSETFSESKQPDEYAAHSPECYLRKYREGYCDCELPKETACDCDGDASNREHASDCPAANRGVVGK
jgi:hypothetical protein